MNLISVTGPYVCRLGIDAVKCGIRADNLNQNEGVVVGLEQKFNEYTGARHAVALNSGTAALHLALLAHGVSGGCGVITSPLCLPAVGCAVTAVGATTVFADINPYTLTIAPLEAERAITQMRSANRPGVLLAVHAFGHVCDMDAMADIAERYGLGLIEVAWEALGAKYHDSHVGRYGTTCYSFQQGLSAGEDGGGMLTTDNDEVAALVRSLANHGCDGSGRICRPGFDYRMTDTTASLALERLIRADTHAEIQMLWAMELTHGLKQWDGLVTPAVLPGSRHAFQRYALRVTPEFQFTPQDVCRELLSQGIESSCCPLLPLHQHPFYQAIAGHDTAHLPNTDRVASELVFLPMHPYLDGENVARIVRTLSLMATHVPEDQYEPES